MSTLLSKTALQVRLTRLEGGVCTGQNLIRRLACGGRALSVWSGPNLDLIGVGCAWRASFSGPAQARQAARAWADVMPASGSSSANDRIVVGDEDGAGPFVVNPPLAFGSFGFGAADSGVLIAPALVVVRRGGHAWAVTQTPPGGTSAGLPDLAGEYTDDAARTGAMLRGPGIARILPGSLSERQWVERVSRLITRLRAGEAAKAVLARDVIVQCRERVLSGWLAAKLAAGYPSCWTYAVDGLVGATPEILAAGCGGRIHARVLAGTAGPGRGATLIESAKDLREHALAVESVRAALAPLARSLDVPRAPFVLKLPNVVHLASDVFARSPGLNSLRAAAALHPTAAVCGMPRAAAAQLIAHFEGMKRGRYAAPVGWMDASGDGQWGIALRCGQIDEEEPTRVRVLAGCGIMPDSDPERELIETRQKMRPVLAALGAR